MSISDPPTQRQAHFKWFMAHKIAHPPPKSLFGSPVSLIFALLRTFPQTVEITKVMVYLWGI